MKKSNKIRVFLSRPNPFTEEQAYLIKQIKLFLLENNIETITLQAKDYSTYESLTVLNKMIKKCYGMIILAFGHTYIQYGEEKQGAIKNSDFFESEEKQLENVWITSVFCHIEGSIAVSNAIPVLILKQINLKKEGIIKDDNNIYMAQDFNVDSKESINKYIKNFKGEEVNLWIEKDNNEYKKIENYIV